MNYELKVHEVHGGKMNLNLKEVHFKKNFHNPAPKQTFLLAYAPLNFDLYGVVAAMRAGEKKRGSCRVFSSRHGLGRSRARSSIYASKWCNFEKLQRLEITIFGWQTSSAEGLQQQPEIKACSRWLAFSFGGGVDRPSIIYGQGFPTT